MSLNFIGKYVRLKWKTKVNVVITMIIEYAWMCPYKQDSEYALDPKYAKILTMAKFWLWHISQYASLTQRSEYARICLDRLLDISWVLNMPRFWIWQGLEYSTTGRYTVFSLRIAPSTYKSLKLLSVALIREWHYNYKEHLFQS